MALPASFLQLTLTKHGDGADGVLVSEAVVRPRFGRHLRPQRLGLHRRDGKLNPELVPPVVLHVILCRINSVPFYLNWLYPCTSHDTDVVNFLYGSSLQASTYEYLSILPPARSLCSCWQVRSSCTARSF